jgi:hypothetical protein
VLTQSEMLLERERKSQTSVEQLTAELATERSMCLTFLDFFEVKTLNPFKGWRLCLNQ